MALTKYTSALKIVQRAMGAVGLAIPNTAAGNQDPTVTQFFSLLGESGQALMKMRSWQQLQKTWVFTADPNNVSSTDPAAGAYDPPADFDELTDQTAWNRTGRLPLLGPMSAQQWQMLEATVLGSGASTIRLMYRFQGGQMLIFRQVGTPQRLAIEYNSRGWVWVQDAAVWDTAIWDQGVWGGGPPSTVRDLPVNDSDICLFDSQLLVMKLKLDWKRNKGFATDSDVEDFNACYDDVTSRDAPAPDLNLAGIPAYPYLNYNNLPETNYGL
jgi:hypothetical protein